MENHIIYIRSWLVACLLAYYVRIIIIIIIYTLGKRVVVRAILLKSQSLIFHMTIIYHGYIFIKAKNRFSLKTVKKGKEGENFSLAYFFRVEYIYSLLLFFYSHFFLFCFSNISVSYFYFVNNGKKMHNACTLSVCILRRKEITEAVRKEKENFVCFVLFYIVFLISITRRLIYKKNKIKNKWNKNEEDTTTTTYFLNPPFHLHILCNIYIVGILCIQM